jgi:hypothetical protein
MLLTLQVTAVVGVPVTAAVNGCWAPTSTVTAVGGVTVTATAACTVTVAVANRVWSATLVARTVIVAGDGTVAGAV